MRFDLHKKNSDNFFFMLNRCWTKILRLVRYFIFANSSKFLLICSMVYCAYILYRFFNIIYFIIEDLSCGKGVVQLTNYRSQFAGTSVWSIFACLLFSVVLVWSPWLGTEGNTFHRNCFLCLIEIFCTYVSSKLIDIYKKKTFSISKACTCNCFESKAESSYRMLEGSLAEQGLPDEFYFSG